MSNVGIITAWDFFQREIRYTFGESPFVEVCKLEKIEEGYELDIIVTNRTIAKALREILPDEKKFGNINVFVVIFDKCGNIVPRSYQEFTPEMLANTFCTALYCNPLFKGVVIHDANDRDEVVVIIGKEVVQFNAAYIGELCGDYNEVAAKVFMENSLLEFPPGISASYETYDHKCNLECRYYCSNRHNNHKCQKRICNNKRYC